MTDMTAQTVVVGLGVTGLSVARFLSRQGLPVRVVDSRENPPGLSALQQECPAVPVQLGKLSYEALCGAGQIVLSPGLSLQEPAIQQALAKGAEVIGDIELFARHAQAPVVAITGANGKSTVTTLVAEMAAEAGLAVRVGGNLGLAALDLLETQEADLYVLELSSFQLDTTHSLRPTAAVVLNITPDHMDRYDDLTDYAESKRRIYRGDGVMVVNRDDALVAAMSDPDRRVISFGLQADAQGFCRREHAGQIWLAHGEQRLLPVTEMVIQGLHNQANALAALALGTALGLELAAMLTVLRRFTGLPHRCERVPTQDGVFWYNDSKGTNVGASCAAIQGLAEIGEIILIAGGVGKGADFTELGQCLPGRVSSLILFGRDAQTIAAAVPATVLIHQVTDLKAAVSMADELAVPGNIVLFSPACASFDMFPNYVVRGETFVSIVQQVAR